MIQVKAERPRARPLAPTRSRSDTASVVTEADGEELDEVLVGRACDGERAAMAELHRRYAKVVHAVVLAKISPAEADDLTQDVFVQAMGRLGGLRDRAKFGAWITTIARNAVTDHHRRRRSVQELAEDDAVEPARAHRRLLALEALAAIRDLPESYQEVLIMRLVEGMTGPEIAARCGLKPGSLRVKLHRGITLLRERLAGGAAPLSTADEESEEER